MLQNIPTTSHRFQRFGGFSRAGRQRRHARILVSLVVAALGSGGGLRANPPSPNQNPSAVITPAEVPPYWFGVAVENLPPAIAEQLKLKPDQGVMVMAVFAGSPAEKAGLRQNDLLIEVNGKPLTSQEDLAKAANRASNVTVAKGDSSKMAQVIQTSDVVYLRKGDRRTARINPERRPADTLLGGNDQVLNQPVAGANATDARNIVLSNGAAVQFGPGYRIDARSQENLQILRQAANNGQTIILTQDTDAAGNVKNTINDGKNTYVVDPKNIEELPANYRPLARQRFGAATVGATTVAGQAVAADKVPEVAGATDERLKRLEQQNEELQAQVRELKALLLRTNPMPANGAASVPAGK